MQHLHIQNIIKKSYVNISEKLKAILKKLNNNINELYIVRD